MAKFEIVIDSTVILPSKVARPSVVLPFSFTVNGKVKAAKDCSPAAAKEALQKGYTIRSQITPKDATLSLEKLLDEGKDVLLLCVSSGVSESYCTADYIVQGLRIKYPDRKVIAIDTLSCGGGEGLLLSLACELQASGLSIDEVAKRLDEAKLNLHHILYVEDTSILAHSGVISPTEPSIVNVKSIFDLNKHGQIGIHSKTLGRKKAISDTIKYVANTIDKERQDILITYTDEQEAKLIAERLSALLPSADIEYKAENPFVSAYLGDSSVCVCFFGEPRKV